MRILFLSHYFPPEGNAPASRVHQLCRRWVADGHQVTVLTCAPNHPTGKVYPGYRNRVRQHESIDGIEVIRVWTFLAANQGTLRRSLNYASFLFSAVVVGLFVRRPDVLVATSPQFFCGVAGMVLRWLRRVPFSLEIRDIWPESIATVGAVRTNSLIRPLEWLERAMYRSAHRIVTVGEGYKEQLIDRGVWPGKIDVVPNGVDVESLAPAEPAEVVRQRHGLDGQFVCAYVGTICMASGLDVVLDAAAMLKKRGRDDIAFLLVGDGAVREQLQSKAKSRGLANVVFTGQRGKQEVPSYLAAVDACLVHLKRKDLFRYVLPSKIFEAAGMRKPIILGVEGHAARLIEQARAGIVIEPEDATDLGESVMRLADDAALCKSFGDAGHDHVIRHFNRHHLAESYLNILQQLVEPAGEPVRAHT